MRAFLFVLLLSISLEQGIIKRSTRSKHGENCVSDSACEEGFICRRYRCMTTFESKNLKELGLLEKNICDLKRKCKTNEKCYKHRCVPINTPPDKPRERTMNQSDAHLVFAGSILLGKLPYLSGVKENNTFDYNHLFTHIQEYIKAADLAAVEQETVFHIPQQGKTFKKEISNTPKELGDAIANAGFKLVMHGSTYSYNQKDVGIINTLNFWKTNHPEVKTLGISATPQESENDYFIFTHEDLKIGIINFSGFAGNSIPKKNKFMVNTFNKTKIEHIVTKLRVETDYIIVVINWGDKDKVTPNKNQIKLAKLLTHYGVNLIIGNHPYFIQPVSHIATQNGNKALVIWSLGSLIGDNHKNKINLSALASIVISKANGKTFLSSLRLIPLVNHKVKGPEYSVYKLHDYTDQMLTETKLKLKLKNIRDSCSNRIEGFGICW